MLKMVGAVELNMFTIMNYYYYKITVSCSVLCWDDSDEMSRDETKGFKGYLLEVIDYRERKKE